MAEKKYTESSTQGPENQNAALLDVIMRGLDMAKRKPESGEGKGPGEGGPGEGELRDFCALAYGTPGHFCFLAYYHPPE